MLFLILVCTIIVVISLRVKRSMNYWKDRNVSFIKPFPFLGNSAPLVFRKRSFMDHLKYLYNAFPNKRYGGTYGFMKPQLLIRDPDLIKQLTVKDFDHFTDRVTPDTKDVDPMFAKNLIGLKGQNWRDMRSTLSPSFTSSKMKFLFTLIFQCAEQFTNRLLNEDSTTNAEIEMKDLFSRFTNDAIATSAFGITVDSLTNKENEFYLTGKDATSFTGLRAVRFFGYFIVPSLMRLLKITIFPPSLNTFFRSIVKETIHAREEMGIIRPDMIHLLIEARKGRLREETERDVSDGFAAVSEGLIATPASTLLSDEDITAQAVLFFFAGFDTASTVMSFMAYELALQPDIQLRLQDEITVMGELTYETILRMKYLDMVVSEALRKWTPGVGIDRVCVRDYEISASSPEEVPVVIKKGASILIPTVGIHYDPQYYPDPDRFDPERFSVENRSKILPFTYLPFGVGPRNCIASRFALMEVKILFCLLLSKFDIVTIEKTPGPNMIKGSGFSMIPKDGLWLGFKQRCKKSDHVPK